MNNYNFSISKSTLLKRFDVSKLKFIDTFQVDILEDPFDFLLSQRDELILIEKEGPIKFIDYIVLPLYSPKSGIVEEKSGLNMWNARGRLRDENEVYIPIPSWIHEKKFGFFKYKEDFSRKTNSFKVILPNKRELSMKVTQQGGKALQSDPNKELGRWILRDVLKLKPMQLVTKEMLDNRGIDSIKLSKVDENLYYMDFLFGQDSQESSVKRMIVLNWNGKQIGYKVDYIIGIRNFDMNEVELANKDFGMTNDYVYGYIKDEKDVIVILDNSKVFMGKQAEILESMNS